MYQQYLTQQQTMENLNLKDKVAVITGSSSGIGQATAILFVRRGAKVTLHGRNTGRLESAAAECKKAGAKSDQVLVVAGDVTNESCRQDLIKKTVEHFGKIDILVNNAGALAAEPLRDITESGIDYLMDLMFKAPVFLTKCALPHLKKTKGCIINTSTTIIRENFPGFFSYTVAKVAIDKFTEYAALEFREAGIRVNSVKPGVTETALFDDVFGGNKEKVNEFLDQQTKHSMLGCNAKGSDMAEMIAFLASDAAASITAQHFVVDGGRSNYFHHGQSVPVASLDDL